MESGEAQGGLGDGVGTRHSQTGPALHLGKLGGSVAGGGGQFEEDKNFKRDLALRSLAWKVSPAALSIFLSVGTSMLVFPFFTYVHSTGLMRERLPQVLSIF